ncbi:unnamed protein product [Musa banksii]
MSESSLWYRCFCFGHDIWAHYGCVICFRDPGAEQKFKEISNAYERSLYDRYGEADLKGAGMGMGLSISQMQDFSNPFDIFERLFKGMGGMGGTRAARNRAM